MSIVETSRHGRRLHARATGDVVLVACDSPSRSAATAKECAP